jgi:serine/threonine protein kinase/WD40 repeat protein
MSSASSDRNPVDLLAEDFAARLRRGERPSVEEYAARHPELADDIRTLFPALLAMEQLKPMPQDLTGPYAGSGQAGPERLGDYRVLREVGRGGMGIVYEAEQLSLGRRVALKVMPNQALADPRRLERFRREARAAAKLHHTNIVPVFGTGEAEGVHYFAMQFITGQPLNQIVHELRRLRSPAAAIPAPAPDVSAAAQSLLTGSIARPPDTAGASPAAHQSTALVRDGSGISASSSGRGYWRAVARLGAQAAHGLAYAHAHGILHRDIKPSNLLLDPQGTLWITDFGLAKLADDDNLTESGNVVGTLRYMAPERFEGHCDARSDLYALGLTLYELLTFRSAFDESSREKLIAQVTHGEPLRPGLVNREIPRDLETIVVKALARDPEHRYQSAAELAEDLERFADDQPILARRASSLERLVRWSRRNPVVAGLTAGVALLMLALTGVAVGFSLHLSGVNDQLAGKTRLAEEKAKLADEKTSDALEALGREKAATDLGQARLGRLNVENGLRLKDSDPGAALLWYAEALRWDGENPERADVHRRRVAGQLTGMALPEFVGSCSAASMPECVETSPDGRTLIVWGPGHETRAWDLRTGERLLSTAGVIIKQHIGGSSHAIPIAAALPLDGKRLLVQTDSDVHLWDPQKGEAIGPKVGTHVTLGGPGRRFLAAGVGSQVHIIDATDGRTVRALTMAEEGPNGSVRMAFSPDGGRLLLYGGTFRHQGLGIEKSAGLQVWDLEKSQPVGPEIGPTGRGPGFGGWGSTRAELLTSRCCLLHNQSGGSPSLWNVETGEQVWPTPGEGPGTMVVATDGRTAITRSPILPALRQLLLLGADPLSAVVTLNGLRIQPSSRPGEHAPVGPVVIRLWDLERAEPRGVGVVSDLPWPVHAGGQPVQAVSSPYFGPMLRGGAGGFTVEQRGNLSWQAGPLRYAVQRSGDRVTVLDLETGKVMASVQPAGAGEEIHAASSSPDGQRLAVFLGRPLPAFSGGGFGGSDFSSEPAGEIRIYTLPELKTSLWSIKRGDTRPVWKWSPDGRFLALTRQSDEKAVQFWEVGGDSRRDMGVLAGQPNDVVFHPGGTLVAVLRPEGVELRTLRVRTPLLPAPESGEVLLTAVPPARTGKLPSRPYHLDDVHVSFLDGGTRMLVIQRGLIRVWDLLPVLRQALEVAAGTNRSGGGFQASGGQHTVLDRRPSADGKQDLVAYLRSGTAPGLGGSQHWIEVTDNHSSTVLLKTEPGWPGTSLRGLPRWVRLASDPAALVALGEVPVGASQLGGRPALRAWDLRTGNRLSLPESPPGASIRVFPEPDRSGVIVAGGGQAVWHREGRGTVPTQKPPVPLPLEAEVREVHWPSPTMRGSPLVEDVRGRFWTWTDQGQRTRLLPETVRGVQGSFWGKRAPALLCVEGDRAWLADAEDGNVVSPTIRHPSPIRRVLLHSHDQVFLVGADGLCQQYDPVSGQPRGSAVKLDGELLDASTNTTPHPERTGVNRSPGAALYVVLSRKEAWAWDSTGEAVRLARFERPLTAAHFVGCRQGVDQNHRARWVVQTRDEARVLDPARPWAEGKPFAFSEKARPASVWYNLEGSWALRSRIDARAGQGEVISPCFPVLTLEGRTVRLWTNRGEPLGKPIDAGEQILFACGVGDTLGKIPKTPDEVKGLLVVTTTGQQLWNPLTGERLRTWQVLPWRARRAELHSSSGMGQSGLLVEDEQGRSWRCGFYAEQMSSFRDTPFGRGLEYFGDSYRGLAVSHAGRWLAVWTELGEVSVWRLGDGQAEPSQRLPGLRAHFLDEERLIVIGSGYLELRKTNGERAWRAETDQPGELSFAMVAGGRRLLTIDGGPPLRLFGSGTPKGDWRVRLWDLDKGLPLTAVLTSGLSPRLSPDGKLLLTGKEVDDRRQIEARDLETGDTVPPPESVDWLWTPQGSSPDGRFYAVWTREEKPNTGFGGNDGPIDRGTRVYDSRTGQPVSPILMPGGTPVFSADSRYLLVADRVYEAATGHPVGPAGRLTYSVDGVVSPGESSAPLEGIVRSNWKWSEPPPDDPEDLIRRVQLATGRRIDSGGQMIPLTADEGQRLLQEVGRPSPAPSWWLSRLADVAESRSDWLAALAWLDRLTELGPAPEAVARRGGIRARLATQHGEQGRAMEGLTLFRLAFADDPGLETGSNGYNAACCAALVGVGQQGGVMLTRPEQAQARDQALSWLRAELTDQRQEFVRDRTGKARALVRQMAHWQADTDFNGVRGETLAALPPGEAAVWKQLWTDIAALHRDAKAAFPPRWRIDGKELVLDLQDGPALFFGETKWTDYTIELEAMATEGVGELNVFIRADGMNQNTRVILGGWNNKQHGFLVARPGDTVLRFPPPAGGKPAAPGGTTRGRWHAIRVVVRGNTAEVFLDGQPLLHTNQLPQKQGNVGLWAYQTAARFRNVKVTDPEGKVLFEGLPAISPATGQK